jgi:hypothetical protein
MSEERDTAIEDPQNNPGRERARMTTLLKTLLVIVIAVVAIVIVFAVLLWFISPETAKQRQGLALVMAISTGGIAAVVGLYLTGAEMRQTRKLEDERARVEKERETTRAREAALRTCLAQLGRLVTNDKWDTPDTKPTGGTKDQAGSTLTLRKLAQAEALSVLGTLDGPRKRILTRFLYESQLIKGTPEIKLTGGDLRKADLSNLNLTDAYLSGVRLHAADLSRAILDRADLSGSDLSSADLTKAKLRGANLKGAKGITNEELEEQAYSLEGAIMPDGSTHP